MPKTPYSLSVFILFLILSSNLSAQSVTGMSDITVRCVSCPVESYSMTQLDYSAAYWYDARADGFLCRNGSLVQQRTNAYGNPSTTYYLSTPLVYNSSFQIQTNHWIRARYQVQNTAYWNDYYGFSLMGTGHYSGSATFLPGNTISHITTQDIYVGTTYAGFASPSPVISGTVFYGSQTRGSTGFVEIYGQHFDALQGVSVSGTGVNVSVAYQSGTQINVSYSIETTASIGTRNLTVTTVFGASNSSPFIVYE